MNQNKARIPAVSLVRANPQLAANISKLTMPALQHRKTDLKRPESFYRINSSAMQTMSEAIQAKISDSENAMSLFPDIELCAQILVSSVLSPKDMVNTELNYLAPETLLPSNVSSSLIAIIKEEIDGYYSYQDRLPEIIRECLFGSGSYVTGVIPESVVDELINGPVQVSLEEITDVFSMVNSEPVIKNIGILGNTEASNKSFAFEAFGTRTRVNSENNLIHEGLEVIDNFQYLKLPGLARANNAKKVKALVYGKSSLASEDDKRLSYKEFEKILYKNAQTKTVPFVSVPTENDTVRKSIGRPMLMKFPSESVIPVHVPGDPKTHVGYFILIDEEGNPLSRDSNQESLKNLSNSFGTGPQSQMSSALLNKAKINLMNQDTRNISLDQAASLYASVVESDLINRLRNGVYGTKMAIAGSDAVYRIMLARTFSNQLTKLIYVPGELITYYAYKYFANGTGKSLLDNLSNLISLRGILLFSKTISQTKNSIPITNVNIELDPDDPDPLKTIEVAMHDVMKINQQRFPFGLNSAADMADWVQRAGFEFNFSNHPGLPSTKLAFENKQMSHAMPDSDLMDDLRKQMIMTFGLNPETVDSGLADAEFATTIVHNNILLSKRVSQIQNHFNPLMTEDIKKIIRTDTTIKNRLIETISSNINAIEKFVSDEEKEVINKDKEGFINYIVDEFIDTMKVALPKPDGTTLETLKESFDNYSEALDKAIDSFVSTDYITEEMSGDIANNIDPIKAALKAYFSRDWMSKNGYMSELADIVTKDEEGKPVIDLSAVMSDHLEGISRTALHYINKTRAAVDAVNKDMTALNIEPESGSSDSNYDSESSGDEDGSGSDDSFDDLGDMDGFEEPTEDESGDSTETSTDKEESETKEEKPEEDEEQKE